MAVKSKRSVMDVNQQPKVGVSKGNPSKSGSSFNWSGWRIWVIGFLIPVLALGVVPLGKLVTDCKYTGASWFYDTFGNISIVIISFSMILAAIFEFIVGSQIGKLKTRGAFLLETVLFIVAVICLFIYTSITAVEAEWGKKLLIGRIFLINMFLFSSALVLGTCSFIRRILWKQY
jgi:hypothetical protein